ncbi:MAG: PulJ/GspJ family protein [Candidatus Dojkabacteria bacterium]
MKIEFLTKLKSAKAYSLLEMLIVLVLTSIVMIGLIELLVIILGVSASTYNRSLIREDMQTIALEFEKDLNNARRVGVCEGENEDFVCELFTDAEYRWEMCPVDYSDFCLGQLNSDSCNNRALPANGQKLSLCKYRVNSDGDVRVSTFDKRYNVNLIRVEEVANEPIDDSEGSESFRKTLLFTMVTSHPNARLNINNVITQSVLSTKNFEVFIENRNQNN